MSVLGCHNEILCPPYVTFLTASLKQKFQVFHRDCYQILLLNFRSSTETVSWEDSQIDFATETFFCTCGGGSQKRFSNLGNSQLFKQRNWWKTLVNMEEFYR